MRPDISLWSATFPLDFYEASIIMKMTMEKPRGGLKVGCTMYMENVKRIGTCVASEYNGGSVLDGWSSHQ